MKKTVLQLLSTGFLLATLVHVVKKTKSLLFVHIQIIYLYSFTSITQTHPFNILPPVHKH